MGSATSHFSLCRIVWVAASERARGSSVVRVPWLAVALLTSFLVLAFPARSLAQRRRYGERSRTRLLIRRTRPRAAADAMFVTGFAMLLLGALLQAAGALDPLFDRRGAQALTGIGLIGGAAGLLIWAQETMGDAWRPDVEPVQGGRLVTDGPFRVVRNPNYDAMLTAGAGSFLLAPDVVSLAGWLLLLASLLLTARLEEPLLLDRFGERYRIYSARTGRFVPGIGRLWSR